MARLSAMESRDLAQRVRQLVKVYADVGAGALSARFSGSRHRRPAIDPGATPRLLSADRATLVRRLMAEKVDAGLDTAERFAAGEFQFLGYPAARLARPIQYQADPFTGGRWPRRHGLMLDYRSTNVGDPKWVWELNRLQHAPLLLAAALLTGESRYADVAVGDLEAWLAQGEPGRGIAWSNGYEPGLRAISMALSVDGLRGIEIDSCRLTADMLASLERHVAWIRRYPSLYTSANNHRVGELAGLIVTAVLVPELRLDEQLPEWLDELHRRADEQFAPDGTHREQAFGYTVFTAELVLLVAGALRSSGHNAPAWLCEVLQRVALALATQLGVDDPEPRYGDCDDGGPTLLGAPWGRSGRSLLAGLRYALGERAPGKLAALDPSAAWLLGDAAISPEPISPEPIEAGVASAWLRDAGVVLLRAGDTTVTFDLGPLGFGPLAAHGHADALHVTLSHAGSLVVGDPGTGSYFGNPAVRDAFRGTGYHATVMVDSCDQAEATGPFLWSSAPAITTGEVDLARRVASGGHDGYARLTPPVSHRRTVLVLDEGLVLLADKLKGDGLHTYSQRWPLPPGATVETLSPGRFLVRIGDVSLLLVTVCSAECDTFVRMGSVSPLEGWWSDRLESISPAPLVGYEVSATGGADFLTLLAFGHDTHSLLDARVTVVSDDAACVVHRGTEFAVHLDDHGARVSPGPSPELAGVSS